jgi:hypothetical protein
VVEIRRAKPSASARKTVYVVDKDNKKLSYHLTKTCSAGADVAVALTAAKRDGRQICGHCEARESGKSRASTSSAVKAKARATKKTVARVFVKSKADKDGMYHSVQHFGAETCITLAQAKKDGRAKCSRC